MKYLVTFTSEIEIEANSREDAIDNVKSMHYSELGEYSDITDIYAQKAKNKKDEQDT
jgi:hypothetical protein